MDEETKTTQEPTGTEPTETSTAAAPAEANDSSADTKAAEMLPADEKKPEAATSTAKETKKEAENPVNEASERISVLEGKLAARDAGVPKEHTDDVLTLARAEMKKNGGTLEAAIEAVLKRHPSMKGTAPASITTGAKTKNDAPTDPDDAKIKEIMGIK